MHLPSRGFLLDSGMVIRNCHDGDIIEESEEDNHDRGEGTKAKSQH